MRNLLLTLGHNSSAILIEDNKIIWGYETERITGIKSDSKFPLPVFQYKGLNVEDIDMAYVTHWSPDLSLSSMSAKHWQPEHFHGIPIRTMTTNYSHHDSHIDAAIAYAGPKFPYSSGETIGLVIDGFGTLGEHLSVYQLTKGHKKLLKRVHGYGTSLGLWYQYATAFMGLKMHEDEYKLLGYEVHVTSKQAQYILTLARQEADKILAKMEESVYGSRFDPAYNVSALDAIRTDIWQRLRHFCTYLNISDPTDNRNSRPLIAHYVQSVLELVVGDIVGKFKPHNLICSGGVFYNVKLNHRLLAGLPGTICVYPLAGDQGNALGIYARDHDDFVIDNLCIGHRTLHDVGHVNGLYYMPEDIAFQYIRDRLKSVGYVNLVRGAMEFGPRALCNTSTLALPSKSIVDKINKANDRNTVMPMAPVMTDCMYKDLFEQSDQVWKSHEHMIIAMCYKPGAHQTIKGVAHQYQYPYEYWTGRPQTVKPSDKYLYQLLDDFGMPLINTSFNFHGKPIAFDMVSIIENHVMQRQRDPNFETVVIPNA